ncbi:hypothetical protein [Pseudoalteromonas obscura]|uniref:Uncharacterized protein n=1 Tax=Pseudoalteromonas obscura TaxID=3048491 RepID=A0ABT7EIU0_9GAMM|nr:hypothetical protein [Pseudoalteromonas sp. P94(2023)]MDK2594976.1 hypothetical protein [Pseudoalteromonas sp. P94(2023)]
MIILLLAGVLVLSFYFWYRFQKVAKFKSSLEDLIVKQYFEFEHSPLPYENLGCSINNLDLCNKLTIELCSVFGVKLKDNRFEINTQMSEYFCIRKEKVIGFNREWEYLGLGEKVEVKTECLPVIFREVLGEKRFSYFCQKLGAKDESEFIDLILDLKVKEVYSLVELAL